MDIFLALKNIRIKTLKNPNTDDIFLDLKNIMVKTVDRVIIAALNLERLREEKIGKLNFLMVGTVNILVLTETNLDNYFSLNQFSIDGYKRYRKDRAQNGGRVMIYIREDIPSRELGAYKFPDEIESIFIEINLKNSR